MIAVLPHTGRHVRPGQARERLADQAAAVAYAVTAPVRNLLIATWCRQLRRAAADPRPASPLAAPEGTVPAPLPGTVPPHPVYGPLRDTPPEGITVSLAGSPGRAVRIGGQPREHLRWDATAPLPMARPYAPEAAYR